MSDNHNMLTSALISGSFWVLGYVSHAWSLYFLGVAVAWHFLLGFIVSMIWDEDEDVIEVDLERGEITSKTQDEPTMEDIAEMIREAAEKRKVTVDHILEAYRKALEESEDDPSEVLAEYEQRLKEMRDDDHGR